MEIYRPRHWSAVESIPWQEGTGDEALYGHLYTYSSGRIAAIRVTYGNAGAASLVCITWADGRSAQWSVSKPEISVYQDQFGLSVSPDGRRIFVQTCSSGLYCLDASDGKTLWRSASRRGVTGLAVSDATLVAHQCEHALLLMDAATGTVLREKTPARSWEFFRLNETHLICQTTARQWEIIRIANLETVQVIPHRLFPRTAGSEPWCIRDVWLEDGHLWCNVFGGPLGTEVMDAVIPIDLTL